MFSDFPGVDFSQIDSISLNVDTGSGPDRDFNIDLLFASATPNGGGPPDDPNGEQVIGGKIIPIEQTSLILAGANSYSWMIPVALSVLGIGVLFVRRN